MVVILLAVYAVFAPFDTLLNVTAGGTITKYVGILIILCAAVEVSRKRAIVPPGRDTYAWLAFFTLSLLSVTWAVNVNDSRTYLVTSLSLFALFLAAASVDYTFQDVLIVARSAVAGGTAVAIYALYLLRHATAANIHTTAGITRLYLSLGENVADANHTAAALLLPIALAATFLLSAQSKREKFASAGAIFCMLAALYSSGSRGGVLGLATLLLYFAAKSRWRKPFLAACVSIIAMVVAVPNKILSRFAHDQGFGSGRGGIWHVGLLGFKQHWLYGAGAFNFATVFDKTFLRTNEGIFEAWHRPAHNLILSTAVDLGVIGLVVLGIVLYAQFTTLRNVMGSGRIGDIRVALEASMLALFVVALLVDMVPRKYLWLALIQVTMLRIAARPRTRVMPSHFGGLELARQRSPFAYGMRAKHV